jgi:cysteinyl-tRNA synthetase
VLALAQQRWEAKQAREWAQADELRDALLAEGWVVKDRKDGYDLEPA